MGQPKIMLKKSSFLLPCIFFCIRNTWKVKNAPQNIYSIAFHFLYIRTPSSNLRSNTCDFCPQLCSNRLEDVTNTAWKVSKYGVFSDPYFPGISLRIQSECGKIGTRKNSVSNTISLSVAVQMPHRIHRKSENLKKKKLWISKNRKVAKKVV